MTGKLRRIAVLTGGGDCPGLNAAIRAVVKGAAGRGLETVGVLDGFEGLTEGRFRPLSYDDVSGILLQGGTILGSSVGRNPFAWPSPAGLRDLSDSALSRFGETGAQALVVAGGDGTLRLAARFYDKGLRVVVIPKTIDNDVPGTEIAVGFSTAVSTAAQAIDTLRSTARSHHRVMIIETMGREAGWLALASAMASGGDVIIIPEVPFNVRQVREAVRRRREKGRNYTLVVAAEGARTEGGAPVRGSIGRYIEKALSAEEDCRLTVLGHLQRGGPPDLADRLLATSLGLAAVETLLSGRAGVLLAPTRRGLRPIPLRSIPERPRTIPPQHPLLLQAAALGIMVAGWRA